MIPVALALRDDGGGGRCAPTAATVTSTLPAGPARARRHRPDHGGRDRRRRPLSSVRPRPPTAPTRRRRRPGGAVEQPSRRRAPARTPSSSTTSGTASPRPRAPASRSGWPPTAPLPTRRCTSATSSASRRAPTAPAAPPPTTTARRRRRPRRRRPPRPRHRRRRRPPAATAATRRHRRPPPAGDRRPAATIAGARRSSPAQVEALIREIWPDDLEERAAHHRQARERPAPEGPQLVLLRRVRHLLRDGQELARRPGRDVRRAAARRPDEHRGRRTSCTRSPAGVPGRRPTRATDDARPPHRGSVPPRGSRRLAVRTNCARSSMDRASDYGSEGWEFDSLRARRAEMPIYQV